VTTKKRVDSWVVTDDFWRRVEPLIPSRQLDPDKQYLRRPGAGRPAKPARQVFEAIATAPSAPATPAQKAQLAALAPAGISARELAGEAITAVLDHAPGNGAAIGGIKVITKNGCFAARPSGTEDIYKIYAESFSSTDHLQRILKEAQAIVDGAI